MQPYILLVLQTSVVILGAIGLALWLRRALPAPWSVWGWGALAFVGSQAVRLPLLTALTVVSRPYFSGIDADSAFWINFAVLVPTSGLFEEGARYIVLCWAAKNARRWEDAVMFGAGHGGIEAILVFGASLVSSLVLLATGDAVLAALQQTAPEQVAAVSAQLATLHSLQPLTILPGIWERVLAITFHISASILVLLAVRERRLSLLLLAMLWHMTLNGALLIVTRFFGLGVAEVALTLISLLAVAIIVGTRRAERRRLVAVPGM
jgi:uncharacterized membrane protein YhfC